LLLEQGDKEAAEASRLVDRVLVGLAEAQADGDVREAPSELRSTAERVVEVSRKSSERRPVLWVDDNPRNNTGIVAALADLKIQVVTATSTREALDRLSEANYSMIISDVGRLEDGADHPQAGLELLQALRDRNVTTPVVFFTGTRGAQQADALRAAGALLVTRRTSELIDAVVRAATRT